MNFLGIGTAEFFLILVIAVLIVGPKRLVEGAVTARKYLTQLHRKREELTAMVKEAVEYEEMKEEMERQGIAGDIKELHRDLTLDTSLNSEISEIKEIERDIRGAAVRRPSGSSRPASGGGPESGEDLPSDTVSLPPPRAGGAGEKGPEPEPEK